MARKTTKATAIIEKWQRLVAEAEKDRDTARDTLDHFQVIYETRKEMLSGLMADLAPRTKDTAGSGKKGSSKKSATGGKSPRASSVAAAVGGALRKAAKEPKCVACYEIESHSNHGTGEGQHKFETNVSERILRQLGHGAKCVYEIDGKVCHGLENDGVHDSTMGYAAYHEFVTSETSNAATGD